MSYLLDTNIISELHKPRPHKAVLAWMSTRPNAFISAISVGEIRRGIEMRRGKSPDAAALLEKNLEELERQYHGKIFAFDQAAAHVWGEMTAMDPHNPIDAQIAAVASVRDAILVTRNVKDFKNWGVHLFNPFEFLH